MPLPPSAPRAFRPDAIIVNSFSKYFCMTGWRIGWMVVPPALVRAVERLQQNLAISVPTLSQIAAEAAFEGRAELEDVRHGYEENRRILLEGLPRAGLDSFLPADGAFYLYADVSRFSTDSFAFATRMLEEAGVAATPGVDFDPLRGKHFLRLCYAGARRDMHEAVERIGNWLASNRDRTRRTMSDALFDILRKVTTATITTMLLKKGIRRCWMNGPKPLAAKGERRHRAGLYAALRAGAGGSRDAGKLGPSDIDPRRDRGNAGGRHRGCRRHGRAQCRHLWRYSLRADEEAQCRRACHRWRPARPRRRFDQRAAGLVRRHGGAGLGQRA